MSSMASLFTSYIPYPCNRKVQTTDGTLLIVSSIGIINIYHIGKLENVPNVPKIFISLVLVKRIASLILYESEFDRINGFLCDKMRG